MRLLKQSLVVLCLSAVGNLTAMDNQIYDATTTGKEILTPKPAASPKITGATIFGVRPGKPIRFCASATGEKPIAFSADGLPAGVSIDPDTGWITGRAPKQNGDVISTLTAQDSKGSNSRKLTLRVGDTICLTPPMGWNSWGSAERSATCGVRKRLVILKSWVGNSQLK